MVKIERLETTANGAHGRKGNAQWANPRLVAKSDKPNRADQGNNIIANEYLDEPDVLEQKVNLLAEFIKNSKYCVAYTGAGLSRAAGIGDYASKASNSIANNVPKLKSNLDAQPTYSHRAIVALERAGYIANYVQQNHDGLPQKAGFPQEKINEIHGAWYDPSNPVVQFSGSLRTDLFNWMLEAEEKADLCLCLGTSLSGMNADRMASTPAKRMIRGEKVFGTVIINLQQTRLDDKTSIRIWAKLDDVFSMLAQKLNLDMTPINPSVDPRMKDKFAVPYDKDGNLDHSKRMIWDLSTGSQITVRNPQASNFNLSGKVSGKDSEGNYLVIVGKSTRVLGRWWIHTAIKGAFHVLPFVNTSPSFVKSSIVEQMNQMEIGEGVTPSHDAFPSDIKISQTHSPLEGGNHKWSVYISKKYCPFVTSVTWDLHKTFSPPVVTETVAPFLCTRTGWGTFKIRASITLIDGRVIHGSHTLSFDGDRFTSRIPIS